MQRATRLVLALSLVGSALVVAPVADAGADDPGTVRPCGQEAPCPTIRLRGPVRTPFPADDPLGAPGYPVGYMSGVSPKYDYVEQEYFVSGTTNVFNYASQPAVRGAQPGDALVAYKHDVPYSTRMVVRRPAKAYQFNGSVIVEFMNSTSGLDQPVAWQSAAPSLSREGYAYIGVTTSGNQALPFLVNGCGGLAPECGTRYAGLSITDNGQEYEIISQIVTGLKSGASSQVPMPRRFVPRIERVYVYGESQQAGSAIMHANEFAFDLVDGYMIQSGNRSRAPRGGFAPDDPTSLACGTTGAPEYPDCVATLAAPEMGPPRNDLPMPVYHVQSEYDVRPTGIRVPDADISANASYRLIEVAGAPHSPIHTLEILPGTRISDICEPETTSFGEGPIFGGHVLTAMFENMERQIEDGVLPPHGTPLTISNGALARDADGNVLGGVRLPEMDVPTATYFGAGNQGRPGLSPLLELVANLACRLSGKATPFPPEVIAARYPTHGSYVRQIKERTRALVAGRFLLPGDAKRHIRDAVASDVGR